VEVGKVFTQNEERLDICFGLVFTNKTKGAEQKIRGMIDEILKQISAVIQYSEPNIIASGNKAMCEVGVVGEVGGLRGSTSRINLELEGQPRGSTFQPYSNEPFIVRDIAIFVPNTVKVEDILNEIKTSIGAEAGTLLVKGPDLFDTYTKNDQTSYAFRMIFQAFDRTLSDGEANSFMEKAYSMARARGWTVR
jgi:phenylalanyl-tRNA synthetase beta subunit